ncbi:MAG: hypothetical protein EHM75_09895 [Desulfobacteraceae bacterium]|nr:MAG: hypothetical protein EHM75_09895 [Desulfobacteraceae bacterium]
MFPDKPGQETKSPFRQQAYPWAGQQGGAAVNRPILLYFNELLDFKANLFSLNERVIEGLVGELNEFTSIKDHGYWLTLARINELALVCAGNYADNCEFSLVGDLLVNPRLVLVHVSGLNQPLTKKRHIPLSEQFQQGENDLHQVRQWLKRETRVEVKTEALLPELRKRLENSGHIPREYLDSVEQRKRRIADLIGFLASAGISDTVALHAWQKKASPADRVLLESNLCRFDFECFFEMGRLFREWAPNLPTSSDIFLTDGFRSSGFEA